MTRRLERGFSPESGERSLGNFIVYKDDWKEIYPGITAAYSRDLVDFIRFLIEKTANSRVGNDLIALQLRLFTGLLTKKLRKIEFIYNSDVGNGIIHRPEFSFNIEYRLKEISTVSKRDRLFTLAHSVFDQDGVNLRSGIEPNQNQFPTCIGLVSEKKRIKEGTRVATLETVPERKVYSLGKLVPIGQ